MKFAEVAVDVPTRPGRTFSYGIPETLEIRAGHLVRVPFGSRTLQGIVFTLTEHPQVAETKDITTVVFDEPLLDAARLRLARWVSEYYLCSLFEAAAPMLPPGGRVRARTLLTLADTDKDTHRLTPLQERILDYIGRRGSVSQDSLVRALGGGAASSLTSLVHRGILRRDYSLREPSVRHRYRTLASLAADSNAAIDEWLAKDSKRAPRQAALVEHLREIDDTIDVTEARREFGASAVKTLLDKSWLMTKTVAVDRDPLDGRAFPRTSPPHLTPEQVEAVAGIRSAVERPSAQGRAIVIQGVTGSGKTV